MKLESVTLLLSDSRMEIFTLSNVLNAAWLTRLMIKRELSLWENLHAQKKLNARIMTIILLLSHSTMLPNITKMRKELLVYMTHSEKKLELCILHDD